MPVTPPEELLQLAKWFTRARKFPQLVGKTHDGKTIWGGPYTFTQVFTFVAILVVASKTSALWAKFGLLGNITVAVGLAYGVTWALGRLPVGARNPVSVVMGVGRALTCPSAGRLRGRPIHIAKPHRATSSLAITMTPNLTHPHRPGPAAAATPTSDPAPVTADELSALEQRPVPPPPMTVVQRLLAIQTAAPGGGR